jgi:hypothetical protein
LTAAAGRQKCCRNRINLAVQRDVDTALGCIDVRDAMVSARRSLQELAAWWVTQIPRQPPGQAAGPAEGDLLAIQRLAALTSAYQAGGPVAFGWLRQSAGGPVQVLVAGEALAAGPDGGYALLTLPSGGRGEATDGESAVATLEQLSCWGRIGAVADGLLASQTPPSAAARSVRPSLDDRLLATWPGPSAGFSSPNQSLSQNRPS